MTPPVATPSYPPHRTAGTSIASIMWTVVAALMPAAVFSAYLHGVSSLVLLAAGALTAVGAEALFQVLLRRPLTAHDGSAVVTGLLVAMNVPPGAPPWLVVAGSAFAIIIVKQLFGGLGSYIFNPALAARLFLAASWPLYMNTGWHRFAGNRVLAADITCPAGFDPALFDALSAMTPLAAFSEGLRRLPSGAGLTSLQELFLSPALLKSMALGTVGGCVGEISAVALLAGGLLLLARRVITWHIPLSFIGTVAGCTYLYYLDSSLPPHLMALFHVLSGGLLLGALFLATDTTSSPVTRTGMILFGVGCGLITFALRIWGTVPEGTVPAILVMNALVPLIDRSTRPRVFGVRSRWRRP